MTVYNFLKVETHKLQDNLLLSLKKMCSEVKFIFYKSCDMHFDIHLSIHAN